MVITIIITLSVENFATPLYPPLKIIDERQIFSLKSIGLKWKQIASLIGVSESMLKERRKSFDDEILTYTVINDYELDNTFIVILNSSPNSGERMVIGALQSPPPPPLQS